MYPTITRKMQAQSGVQVYKLAEGLMRSLGKNAAIKTEEIIPVIGITGAGKSTTISYLLGHEMVKEEIDGCDCIISKTAGGPNIGVTGESETPFAEVFKADSGLAYVDCPGFEENRGAEEKAIGIISTQLAIKNAKNIGAVLIVISFDSLLPKNRGRDLKDLLETLQAIFKEEIYEFFPTSVRFLFTHAKNKVKNEHVITRINTAFPKIYLEKIKILNQLLALPEDSCDLSVIKKEINQFEAKIKDREKFDASDEGLKNYEQEFDGLYSKIVNKKKEKLPEFFRLNQDLDDLDTQKKLLMHMRQYFFIVRVLDNKESKAEIEKFLLSTASITTEKINDEPIEEMKQKGFSIFTKSPGPVVLKKAPQSKAEASILSAKLKNDAIQIINSHDSTWMAFKKLLNEWAEEAAKLIDDYLKIKKDLKREQEIIKIQHEVITPPKIDDRQERIDKLRKKWEQKNTKNIIKKEKELNEYDNSDEDLDAVWHPNPVNEKRFSVFGFRPPFFRRTIKQFEYNAPEPFLSIEKTGNPYNLYILKEKPSKDLKNYKNSYVIVLQESNIYRIDKGDYFPNQPVLLCDLTKLSAAIKRLKSKIGAKEINETKSLTEQLEANDQMVLGEFWRLISESEYKGYSRYPKEKQHFVNLPDDGKSHKKPLFKRCRVTYVSKRNQDGNADIWAYRRKKDTQKTRIDGLKKEKTQLQEEQKLEIKALQEKLKKAEEYIDADYQLIETIYIISQTIDVQDSASLRNFIIF